jgi:hypothetical protein
LVMAVRYRPSWKGSQGQFQSLRLHNMLDKIFAGSAFKIPPELEADFTHVSAKIIDAIDAKQDMLLARLWVEFYRKFDQYYQGQIQ